MCATAYCHPKTYVFVESDSPSEQYQVYAFVDEKYDWGLRSLNLLEGNSSIVPVIQG